MVKNKSREKGGGRSRIEWSKERNNGWSVWLVRRRRGKKGELPNSFFLARRKNKERKEEALSGRSHLLKHEKLEKNTSIYHDYDFFQSDPWTSKCWGGKTRSPPGEFTNSGGNKIFFYCSGPFYTRTVFISLLRCQAVGARPPPEITWWRGSTQLRENVTNKVREKNSFSCSYCFLLPL